MVITGLGVLAANGTGKQSFWDSLCRGESGVDTITLCDVSDLPCKIAGEVKGFEPEKYLEGKIKPKRLSRTSQFAVAAAKMAVADSGLEREDLERNYPIPIRVGISMGGLDYLENGIKKIPTVGARFISPASIGCVDTATAIAVAEILEIHSDLKTFSTTCVAGMDAIADAATLIRRGEADLVIAGGADAPIETCMIATLSGAKMLCTYNGDPGKASRPFDLKRSGGVLAEGSGFVVMESLPHAIARGARPYAEVVAFGTCTDSDENAGSGIHASIKKALNNAACLPDKVDAVYAHGPSDLEIDMNEARIIKRVFGDRGRSIPVTSIKGATANSLSVGGPHQIIAACMGFYHGLVPPTANYENFDPECDLAIVSGRPAAINCDTVLINSHGIGKVNSSMLLARF